MKQEACALVLGKNVEPLSGAAVGVTHAGTDDIDG
jgi:hypothetical protein